MAENGESTAAVPPNSETTVETTVIMESLPDSEISQTNESNAMDIVSMALSNVTDASNLITVVDTDEHEVCEAMEEVETVVQQFDEQVEIVEQQVVHEIPISNDMMITSADGQIILPSNSTAAELSAVETLVGGALQQTVLSQPSQSSSESDQVTAAVSTVTMPMGITFADTTSGTTVPVVDASHAGVVNITGGPQGISASSLLGSIATMIDSTEASISHASATSSQSAVVPIGIKMNTSIAPTSTGSSSLITRTVPANNAQFVTPVTQPASTLVDTVINIASNIIASTAKNTASVMTVPAAAATPASLGLTSIINSPTQTSLPSTITIKTPPGSNSVSQTLLNSILNNTDVQTLLRRNPGQPITIVRVPEDSPGPGGKNVNKITVTTGGGPSNTVAAKNPMASSSGVKTVMRVSTPVNKSSLSTPTIKTTSNNTNQNTQKRKPGRPPKFKEQPQPVVVKSKKTRSGRVSRPPLHRVRDYKTIHIQEMGDGNDDREDFADYDGELVSRSQLDFPTYGGRPHSFKCKQCDKAYIGKGGLARHFKNNPDHGDPAALGITYDEDQEAPSSAAALTPAPSAGEKDAPDVQMPSAQTTPFKKKRGRGRPPLRPPSGDPDFHPNKYTPAKRTAGRPSVDIATLNLHRRKQRIQDMLKTIGDEDLMELALPRLAKAITVWEFLLMKVEEAHSQKLPFQEILQQFEDVRKHVKLFAGECLQRVSVNEEASEEPTTNNLPQTSLQGGQETLDETAKDRLPTSENKDNPDNRNELKGSSPNNGERQKDTDRSIDESSSLETNSADAAKLSETSESNSKTLSSDDKLGNESKSSVSSSDDKSTSESNSKTLSKEDELVTESNTKTQSSDDKLGSESNSKELSSDDKLSSESKSKTSSSDDKSASESNSKELSSDDKLLTESKSKTSSSDDQSASESNSKVLSSDEKLASESSSKAQSSEDKSASELNSRTPSSSDDKSTNESSSKTQSSDKNTESDKDDIRTESHSSSANKINDSRTGTTEPTNTSLTTSNESKNSDPPKTIESVSQDSADFLYLDDEVAKALGMELGKYSVKDWTNTTLPTVYKFMYKFAKNSLDYRMDTSEEEEGFQDETELGEEPMAAKRQKMSDEHSPTVERPMPPMQPISNSAMHQQTARQPVLMQVPRNSNIPALKPVHPVPQPTAIGNKNNQVVADLQTMGGAGDANTSSSAGEVIQQEVTQQLAKQDQHMVSAGGGRQIIQQQVVEQVMEAVDGMQVVHKTDHTVEEPMEVTAAGQVIEKNEEVVESKEVGEAEGVEYQPEEQGHSIVPEGSTIMQMEDGTFLVQKPDGTAMQIHCPEGMTIETIQALLSMDAGNILQSAE